MPTKKIPANLQKRIVKETDLDNVQMKIEKSVIDDNVEGKNIENKQKSLSNPSFLIDVESKAIVSALINMSEKFSYEKLIEILPKLIIHVENYKNLSGTEKKSIVINMLKHLIDITDGPGNDDVWDPILKRLVPVLIDTLITVDQGKLKLKKKTRKFLFCC